MAEKATNFDIAVHSLIQRRRFNFDKLRADRGYSTDGAHLWLNGHLLAKWHDGAVRMFLNDAQWHQYLVAQAIPKVRSNLEAAGVLAERGEVTCKEHEDCKLHAELGAACALTRTRPAPLPLPYFEAQEARRRVHRARATEIRGTDEKEKRGT